MTHENNNSKRGLPVLIGIVILGIAFYYSNSGSTFAKNKTNTNSNITSTYSAQQGGGCGGGGGGCNMGGGCGGSSRATNSSVKNTTSPIPSNTIDEKITYETVNIGHDEYRLLPEIVTLSAGKNYKLIITPSADGGGCMNNMTIPGIDENIYDIKNGVPITIIINNAKAGNYEVVCGNMGMYQGQIIIQ